MNALMFKVLQGVLGVTRKEIGSGPLDLMIVYCMESFGLENKKDLNPIFCCQLYYQTPNEKKFEGCWSYEVHEGNFWPISGFIIF